MKYTMILDEVDQFRNTLQRALLKLEHIEHICSDKVETIGNLRIIERTTGKATCKKCSAQGVWVNTNKGWRIADGSDKIHKCKGELDEA